MQRTNIAAVLLEKIGEQSQSTLQIRVVGEGKLSEASKKLTVSGKLTAQYEDAEMEEVD